jgi:3-oxoacyl-[acyl-carrier protein] reductase
MELKGKNALVTGGSRGIGRAISLALADKGVNVAVNYHGNTEKAQETVSFIRERGVKSIELQADVSDIQQVKEMVERVKEYFSGIDILINNAGISGNNTTLDKIEIDEWEQVIDINLTGVYICCKACLSELRKNKGKIVNISSIAGKMGGSLGCHYAASKAGLHGLTFALATELAPEVNVNAVAPGPVGTELITPEIKEKLARKTPFNRVATPEEVAHSVVFLLENDYVSGEILDLNAARYMD